MRFGITGQFQRSLARGAAVLVVGGVAAGCSGGATQLTDGLVTNSTPTAQSSAPGYQAYPGDVGAPTARRTADAGMKVIRPQVDVGSGTGTAGNAPSLPAPASTPVYTAPAASRSEIVSQPLPAPQRNAASAPASSAPLPSPGSASMAGQRTAAAPADPAPQPVQPSQKQAAVLTQAPKPEAESKKQAGDQPAASNGAYTVVSGDTLYGISRKTGVSVDRLKQENGLSDGMIRIGQTLKIPSGTGGAAGVDQVRTASAPASHSEPKKEETSQVSTYTAPKAGDEAEKESASDAQIAAVTPDATGVDRLRWPVRGRVVTGFGANAGGRTSDGIDIAVPEGTSVRAAENGVVIYAGDGLKGFGNTVLVRHEDGLVTVYGHASDIKVKRGDKVTRGQEVALSGMTGDADRPKLHFEVRKGTNPVDPTTYLE